MTGLPHLWTRVPRVTVVAPEDDRRLPLARAAVRFWNGALERLGTPLRLGSPSHLAAAVPAEELERISDAMLQGAANISYPAITERIETDVLVILSQATFKSFATAPGPGGRVVIGIPRCDRGPLRRPRIVVSLIAHELGHAIGLGHNEDPTRLMCRDPVLTWEVRRDLARPHAATPPVPGRLRVFRLLPAEKELLRRRYPPGWGTGVA